MAPFAGRYEPLMECGARVKAGEVVGLQHDFERIDLDAWPVRAGVDGVVIAQAWGRWCCKASIFWSPGGLRHLRLDAVLPSMFQLLAEA